jgi:hypothetical protein
MLAFQWGGSSASQLLPPAILWKVSTHNKHALKRCERVWKYHFSRYFARTSFVSHPFFFYGIRKYKYPLFSNPAGCTEKTVHKAA